MVTDRTVKNHLRAAQSRSGECLVRFSLFCAVMPPVARFNGITILIHYPPREHNPPHFHAQYGNDEASYGINDLQRTAGKLRRAQERTVLEWAEGHQEALMTRWHQAQALEPLDWID